MDAVMCVVVDQPPPVLPSDVEPTPPRFVETIDLAALPSAVLVAHLFIGSTMRSWKALLIQPDLELIAAELVTYSVEASAPGADWLYADKLDIITLRLLGYERSIIIELWDGHDKPVDPQALPNTHRLARDWGLEPTPRGRMIWAEVDVYPVTSTGLPRRVKQPVPYPRESDTLKQTRQDLELLERVRDAIKDI